MTMDVLRVDGLITGYDGVDVVRDVSFSVGAGQIVALLGPNGAGKTTTLLALAGVIPHRRGTVEMLGRSALGESSSRLAQRGMVLVPDDRGLYGSLTVADTLRLAQRSRVKKSDDITDLFPALVPLWNRRVGLLSGGEQQMVALAAALVRRPKLLMLDEMSLGLAPRIVTELLAAVRQMANDRGVGVLLVEQHARVALEVSDHVVVMRHGEVALAGSPTDVNDQLDLVESSYLGVATSNRIDGTEEHR